MGKRAGTDWKRERGKGKGRIGEGKIESERGKEGEAKRRWKGKDGMSVKMNKKS